MQLIAQMPCVIKGFLVYYSMLLRSTGAQGCRGDNFEKGRKMEPKTTQPKPYSQRNILIMQVLCLFVIVVTVQADTQKILTPRDLLRATRLRHGQPEKPAYENLTKQTPKPLVKEPNAPPPLAKEPPKTPTPNLPPKQTPEKPMPEQWLSMIPAQSQFCLSVNNFQYTISQIDQFMAGLSPVPLGASMFVRMQLARLLGNGRLSGVNMSGGFAVFGPLTNTQPLAAANIAILVPVTDYKLFVSGNPNVSKPDKNGISTIATPGLPALSVMNVSQYAPVALKGNDSKLLETTTAISDKRRHSLAEALSPAQAQQAAKTPIWVYLNVQRAAGLILPQVLDKIQGLNKLRPATGTQPAGNDIAAFISELSAQIKSVALTISPSSDVLNLTVNVSAKPRTEMARVFNANVSAAAQPHGIALKIYQLINMAKTHSNRIKPAELEAVSQLIPQADKADFVLKFSLGQSLSMAAAMAPGKLPPMHIQTKSYIVLAGRAHRGNMALDIVVPKKHLLEVAQAVQAMSPMTFGQPMPPAPTPMASPHPTGHNPTTLIANTEQIVRGKIMATSVTLENAAFQDNTLTIYTGDSWVSNPGITLFIFDIKNGAIPENKSFIVQGDARLTSPESIHVHYRWKDQESGRIKTDSTASGYTLNLKFEHQVSTGIPGSIVLQIPEKQITLQGRFNATIRK